MKKIESRCKDRINDEMDIWLDSKRIALGGENTIRRFYENIKSIKHTTMADLGIDYFYLICNDKAYLDVECQTLAWK